MSLETKQDRPLNPQANWFTERDGHARAGDLVLLISPDASRYLVQLRPHQQLHTHEGIFDHDTLIGQQFGVAVVGSMGRSALLLEPSVADLMYHLKRGSQIIYPKDAAYLVQRLGLRAGSRVVEAGTGSGSLTTALAWAVAPTGMVYTYEVRQEAFHLARNNLERVGLLPYVQMIQASIDDGFQQHDADALFLDVREPWRYLSQARGTLRPGGFFASLLPTTNQVSSLLEGLDDEGFADIAVEELLLRRYKPVPDRLRPDDMMNGHTGYLIFARLVDRAVDSSRWQAQERQRYRARVKAQAELAQEEARRDLERASGGKKYPTMPLP